MESVLIVEDESRMRSLIRDYFNKFGYKTFEAENGIEAMKTIKNNKIDLVILDIMMPYMDGFQVCELIRKESNIPIIMLTAKSEEEDKLMGYELGADDYVTKPFSPKVLVAKGKALLKRAALASSIEKDSNGVFNEDGLLVDSISHKVCIDGEEIQLSPKEYELLLYFIENINIALSRDKILDGVWGIDYYGDLRTVDTHVKRLREKLAQKAYMITTVRGSGYKFEVKK